MDLLTEINEDLFKIIAEYTGEVGRIVLLHVSKDIKSRLCNVFDKFTMHPHVNKFNIIEYIDNINLIDWAVHMGGDFTKISLKNARNIDIIKIIMAACNFSPAILLAEVIRENNVELVEFLVENYGFTIGDFERYTYLNDIIDASHDIIEILQRTRSKLPLQIVQLIDILTGKIIKIVDWYGDRLCKRIFQKVMEMLPDAKSRNKWAEDMIKMNNNNLLIPICESLLLYSDMTIPISHLNDHGSVRQICEYSGEYVNIPLMNHFLNKQIVDGYDVSRLIAYGNFAVADLCIERGLKPTKSYVWTLDQLKNSLKYDCVPENACDSDNVNIAEYYRSIGYKCKKIDHDAFLFRNKNNYVDAVEWLTKYDKSIKLNIADKQLAAHVPILYKRKLLKLSDEIYPMVILSGDIDILLWLYKEHPISLTYQHMKYAIQTKRDTLLKIQWLRWLGGPFDQEIIKKIDNGIGVKIRVKKYVRKWLKPE